MISGSAIERLWHCPASEALMNAKLTTGASLGGAANHDAIEAGVVAGDLMGLPRIVKEMYEGVERSEVEIAFALDIATQSVRHLGSKLARGYGDLKPTEIPLTIDAVMWRKDEVLVVDWKSRKRVTDAAKNWQIKAACVAVMGHYKIPSVTGVIAYLDDGETDCAPFGTFDVPVFFDDMSKLLQRIRDAKQVVELEQMPLVHAGPWCAYCPAMAWCPAQTRQALVLLGDLNVVDQQIAHMTPEQAGKAWELKEQIEKLIERIDGALRLRAQSEFVPLPNGKRLAMIDKSRASFDKKRAVDWIKSHGGNPDDFMGRTYFTQIAQVKMDK